MRVLIVTQYFHPEPWRINGIVQHMVDQGHQVTVLTGLPNYPDGIIPENYRNGKNRVGTFAGAHIIRVTLIARGVSSLRLALNYLSFVITASWKALHLKNDFDIIFGYQLSPITSVIPAILLKWKWQRPLVIYCLDLWPDSILATGYSASKGLLFHTLRLISKSIYRQADLLVVSSRSFIDPFRKSVKISGSKIYYCPQHGDDFSEGAYGCGPRLPNNKINLVFTGNIGQAQSINTLIHAANILQDHEHLVWHFVGSGSALDESKQLVMELGIADRVIFHGRKPITEMSSLYAQADALLISLNRSGWVSKTMPSKLQGYMSSGKPILGSIDGDAPLVIEEAQCGYCAPAEDAQQFAQIVRIFLALTPAQRQEMGIRARAYFEQHFSQRIAIDKLIDSLSSLHLRHITHKKDKNSNKT
jgi:glycosyltransferase involved in cell wall biosynthesis